MLTPGRCSFQTLAVVSRFPRLPGHFALPGVIVGVRGVEHLSRWPRRRRNRQGGLRNRRPCRIVSVCSCCIGFGASRMVNTSLGTRRSALAHNTRNARVTCVRGRSCSAVSASCCSQTGCAFTTALTCGLVQSFAASVVASYAAARASSSAHTSPARHRARATHRTPW